MKPEWRTPSVVAIAQAMRETEDYRACPVLADALDDAGCEDATMLERLRSPIPAWEAQRWVALVYSSTTEAAVRQVEEVGEELGPRAFSQEGDGYGAEVPVTYERLMRIGERWTASDSEWPDYTTEYGADNLQNWGDLKQFWEAYEVITGRRGEGNPFSCSC
jgi:hypothetical protein